MRRLSRVAVGLLAVLGCHRPPPEDPSRAPVARVNGEAITRGDVGRELGRALESTDGAAPPTPEQLAAVRRTVLDGLIVRTLLLQDARSRGLGVEERQVEQAFQRVRGDYPEGRFTEMLAEGQLSAPELRARLEDQLTEEKLFAQVVYPRVAVTEEEIRDFLDAHPDELQDPEQVHAAQIVVKDLDEAKRVRDQLRRGSDFAALARQVSLSADAKLGGDLGWFPKGVMPPEFDAACFALAPGQTSEVVASEYGFHLFRLLERRTARRKDLAQVRTRVERRLLKGKQELAQRDYVKGLRDRASIQIDAAALASIPAPRATPGPPVSR